MKVLFLDIDGVLKEESYKAAFQDECFARLKRIIDHPDLFLESELLEVCRRRIPDGERGCSETPRIL